MAIPHEFTAEAISAASTDAFRPYNDFLQSGEPYVSIYLNNQWLTPPKDNEELEWGKGWYYDTTLLVLPVIYGWHRGRLLSTPVKA